MASVEGNVKTEVAVARLAEKIDSLEDYQVKQNGCLRRMEDKLDALHKWLTGLLGGVIASLILLVLNLVGG